MNEAKKLRKRLFFSQVIVLASFCFVSVVSFAIPLFHHLAGDVENRLMVGAHNNATAMTQWILRAKDLSVQVTSRTRIRQELQKYNNGEITLEKLVRFTRPKLNDAMRISTEIVGITRHDRRGNRIVSLGVLPPPTASEQSSSNSPKVFLGDPFTWKGQLYVWVRAPIIDRAGKLVGNDFVVVNTHRLEQANQDASLLNKEPADTCNILAYPKGDKYLPVFAEAICTHGTKKANSADDMLRFAHQARIANKPWRFQLNDLFGVAVPVQGSSWVLVTSLDKNKLYAPVRRDLLKALFGAVILYALCILVYWKLLSPLANRILIKQKALELEIEAKNASLQNQLTARSQAEKALRESETRLSHIIMGSPVPTFVVNNDHITTHWNAALEKVTGISGDDVIGTNSQWKAFYSMERPVMADLIVDRVPENEVSKYYSGKYRKSKSITAAYEAEDFFPDMGKNGKWLFFTAAPLRSNSGETIGAVETLQDHTARKKAEHALKDSEEKYRLLVEYASDAIFIIQDDSVKFPNPKAIDLIGYSEKELAQMRFFDLIHPADRNGVLERYKIALKSGGFSGTSSFRVRHKTGKDLIVQISSTPIIWENRPAILNLLRDITSQKKIEDELRQSQKMEAIGTLAGGIAHDFNNILSGIFGYAELLQLKMQKDSDMYVYLESILNAGNRAKALVKQILTFSRQSADDFRPVEIQLVARDALKLIESTLPTTISIQEDIQKDCGMVMADKTQIHQVIINLCTNAYHAMEENGGTLSISLKEVEYISGEQNDGEIATGKYVLLAVHDTGTGIGRDVLPLIFDPYFTTKEEGRGTGMGLAVIHGIVKRHGGFIGVDSEVGKGSQFHIHLPIIKGVQKSSDAKPASIIQRGDGRILLIDDQKDVLDVERLMLEELGYQVDAKTCSIEALDAFQANPDGFDLVLTDMTMPKMTGDKLAREISKIRSNMPVIICTGFSERITEKDAAALGVNGFIMKPVVLEELSNLIRKALDETRRIHDDSGRYLN